MKHVFYALRYIAGDEVCEVEGNVCYESYAFKSAAMASAKKANADATKYHGCTVDQYDVIELPSEYRPSLTAYCALAGISEERINDECEWMVNNLQDYFHISGNWKLLMQEDGVYLMFGDEELLRVWSGSWMTPSPDRAELIADFIRLSRITAVRSEYFNMESVTWIANHRTNADLANSITRMNLNRFDIDRNYFGDK